MIEIFNNWQRLSFAEPMWLWLIAAVVLLIPLWKKLRPALAHTNTGMHKIRSTNWPTVVCCVLLVGGWSCFCAALARPKLSHEVMREYIDARDFVIGIDRSGSMGSADIEEPALRTEIDAFEKAEEDALAEARKQFPGLYPLPPDEKKNTSSTPAEGKVQRFQLARYAAYKFIESRPEGDRAAMFTFNDSVYWAWPLGSDLHIVTRKISEISREYSGGTNFDGPVGGRGQIGAFQGAINHFEELGQAKTRVMIFISDGDAGISPERHQEFVQQMQKEGEEIHIFALVCGPKTSMDSNTTKTLRKLVEAVNPQGWKDSKGDPVDAVIWAGDGEAMKGAFALISDLEKSTVELEPVDSFKPVTRTFEAAAGILMLLFLGACTLFRESF